jgi:hypothetical protein
MFSSNPILMFVVNLITPPFLLVGLGIGFYGFPPAQPFSNSAFSQLSPFFIFFHKCPQLSPRPTQPSTELVEGWVGRGLSGEPKNRNSGELSLRNSYRGADNPSTAMKKVNGSCPSQPENNRRPTEESSGRSSEWRYNWGGMSGATNRWPLQVSCFFKPTGRALDL